MPGRRSKISAQQRRYHDYIRRETLKTAAVYEKRLARSRRKELRRVLALCRDYDSPDAIPGVIEANISENSYLPAWYAGIYKDVGVPSARRTARDLEQAKAAGDIDIWLQTLVQYANMRAAQAVVSVSGTFRDSLLSLVQDIMAETAGAIGVEKLTKLIYRGYQDVLEKWQIRRIAQTESMIAMADASAAAADTLDVSFTKTWCISGLGNTRESHEMMDGVTVDQDEPFSLPGGLLMYPHDTSLGASAGEIINCACDVIRRPK